MAYCNLNITFEFRASLDVALQAISRLRPAEGRCGHVGPSALRKGCLAALKAVNPHICILLYSIFHELSTYQISTFYLDK